MLYASKGNHTEILREYLDAIPEEQWAASRQYARRLAICKRRCPDYRNGSCLHCADFIEIRAARRAAKCPAPQPEW
jgi:hypothetical protein